MQEGIRQNRILDVGKEKEEDKEKGKDEKREGKKREREIRKEGGRWYCFRVKSSGTLE